MPHAYSRVYVHLILPFLEPVPVLADPNVRADWHGYMTGICRNQGCPSLRIGGADDHVHLLCRMGRERSLDRLVQEVHKSASMRLRTRHGGLGVVWGRDYGVFSVSDENLDDVTTYILKENERHLRKSFDDEYQRILNRSGGSVDEVYVHAVFSTKKRYPYFNEATRSVLHPAMEEILTDLGCPALRVGGTWDHVHMLCRFSRQTLICRLMENVKKRTSRWLGEQYGYWDVRWQDGYGTFSVSPQHLERIVSYIENQEEHHQLKRFEDEHLW